MLNNHGLMLQRTGDLITARQVHLRGLEIEPNDVGLNYNLSLVLDALKEYSGAIEHARKAISVRPDHWEARRHLARVYLRAELYTEAIECASDLVRSRPSDPAAHLTLARALLEQDQVAAAEAQFRVVVSLDATRADAWFRLGVMALNRWEPRQAVESLLRARELDPDLCGLHTALGIAFQLMDDFDRAEAEYTLGLRTNPNDSFLYSGLGMLYLDKARKSRSLTLAYRALGMFMRASFTRTNHVSLKPLAAATLKLIAKLRAGRS